LGNNWDSFLLTVGIPKDPKGDFPLPTERVTSHRAEAEAGRVAEEGKTLEALSPQQSIPQRRGRPRKNKEVGETQVPSEPRTKSVAEELLMHAIRLEPVEGTSQESWGRRRRTDTEGTDVHEPSQQLKQAQLAIAELYQENRELRQQLAAKTLEASTSQGHEGNMTWLKRQLREAQDTIIQLREAQRMSEERNVKHFKECEPTMEKVPRGSGQHAEEAERERGSAKASDEPEKAQLVSQENASGIKTADETRSMINRLHFFLLRRGTDFVSPHPVSYREVGTLTDTRAENIRRTTMESHPLQRTGVHWTCDSLKKGIVP
jgi:hypothetical protein